MRQSLKDRYVDKGFPLTRANRVWQLQLSWAGHAASFIIACSHGVIHAESEAKGEGQSQR